MQSETQPLVAPETFYKATGTNDKFREFEDQAWSDMRALLNDENYKSTIYGYFLVYFLWDLSSTTQYGKSTFGDNMVDRGQVHGKQASGALIVTATELIFQAHKTITQKYPVYPSIFSKKGLINVFLSSMADTKVIDLAPYPQDITLRIPLDDLQFSVQSHTQLRDAVAINHPEIGYMRIEGHFTGDTGEIAKLIRAVQKEFYRQQQQALVQGMMDGVSSEKMAKEIEAVASLQTLNPEAYEVAVQAIMKKFSGASS
jgi:hypothetical protein